MMENVKINAGTAKSIADIAKETADKKKLQRLNSIYADIKKAAEKGEYSF